MHLSATRFTANWWWQGYCQDFRGWGKEDNDDRVPQVDEAGQDVAGEHDEQSDSDDNIDAYEALASNFGESGSEQTSSDDSCASNEIQKSKKIRITKATPPEPT